MRVLTEMKKIFGALIHAPGRFDEMARRIADTNDRINGVEYGLQEQLNRMGIDWYTDQLCGNREALCRLNRELSLAPTIWGDPTRLEIDETAKVSSCFFNTNGGKIRIGEATFAGSGVRIIASGHDPKLTGGLRRDAEETEGCDITIGKGVWLSSGCTILGPCRIGDNAVISAGAVMMPGTEAPANTIWSGVPARQAGALELSEMAEKDPAVQAAFGRSSGALFTDGWSERTTDAMGTPGHWMLKDQAGLLVDQANWILTYQKQETDNSIIRLVVPEEEKELELQESEGQRKIHLPVTEGKLTEIRLIREKGGKIFVSLRASGQDEGSMDDIEAKEIDGRNLEAIMDEIIKEADKKTDENEPAF